MDQISSPKREKTVPVYLGKESLQKLLDATLQQRTEYCAFRDYAIMATFIYSGLRRGELLGLKMSDVGLETGSLRVVDGKGKKSRVIPMHGKLREALGDWLQYRRTKGHDYLFTTNRGNRIYPSRIQIIWKKTLKRSGVKRSGVTIHTLRHSFATLLLQSGEVDLVSLQHLLGHSRLDTTAIYLHVGTKQLQNAVSAHPLADSKGNLLEDD
jgi:site-specific recombinase XerD